MHDTEFEYFKNEHPDSTTWRRPCRPARVHIYGPYGYGRPPIHVFYLIRSLTTGDARLPQLIKPPGNCASPSEGAEPDRWPTGVNPGVDIPGLIPTGGQPEGGR